MTDAGKFFAESIWLGAPGAYEGGLVPGKTTKVRVEVRSIAIEHFSGV